MLGGGPRLSPGEVTRADEGVLFLDELPEFGRDVLEALRQPLEDGRVSIVRVGGSLILPARFQLVAAMNPCPCGGAGSGAGLSLLAGRSPERYAARVSGPLRDRIDLWVDMPPVPQAELVGASRAEPSAAVAAADRRSPAGRARPPGRRQRPARRGAPARAACRLAPADEALVGSIAAAAGLSARGVGRLQRVARTIADLEGSARVGHDHLEEAARFRVPSGPYAGQLAV